MTRFKNLEEEIFYISNRLHQHNSDETTVRKEYPSELTKIKNILRQAGLSSGKPLFCIDHAISIINQFSNQQEAVNSLQLKGVVYSVNNEIQTILKYLIMMEYFEEVPA